MKLLMIRHGQTEAAEKNYTSGSYDTPVSKKGLAMLENCREQYCFPETEYYYTTPLTRTKQTLAVLFPDKKSDGEIEGLKEHHMGVFESTPRREDASVYQCWLTESSPYEDELFIDFQNRVLKSIKELNQKHKDDCVTVVCHAGVIRAVIMYYQKMKPAEYYSLVIPNGNGYLFDIDEENDELLVLGYQMIGSDPNKTKLEY